jgi:hypothetical protein
MRAGLNAVCRRGPRPRGHGAPKGSWYEMDPEAERRKSPGQRDAAAKRFISCASWTSLSVTPPASWVASVTSTLL